ncbi:hypothetical protein A2U01_0116920, partial [Trifolium medium]|nr:hypothetical protein [Trifolium medium]
HRDSKLHSESAALAEGRILGGWEEYAT